MSELTWVNDNIRLGDIDPWEYNPRLSTKKQAERIVQSHNDFGQVDVFAVGPKNEAGKYPLYNGHQRYSAWLAEFGPDYMVDVRRCSRELTTEERQALTGYLHSGAVGSWNWDILPSIDQDILEGFFAFDADLLKGWQRDTFALGELLAVENDPNEEWKGMPEFNQDNLFKGVHTLQIHFENKDDIVEFSNLIGQTVTDHTKSIWYPKKEHENLKAFLVDES